MSLLGIIYSRQNNLCDGNFFSRYLNVSVEGEV